MTQSEEQRDPVEASTDDQAGDMEGFPEAAEAGTERIFFCLTNLAISRRVTCGPFAIWPLDDPEGLVAKLPQLGAQKVRSAGGQYDLAGKEVADFQREGEILALLLSFASRRDVNIIGPSIFRSDGTKWQYVFMVAPNPTPAGADQGSPWYLGDDALEHFLQQAFALMTGEFDEMRGGAQPQGLRLALYYLNSSRSDDEYSETMFLKAWLALETLVQHSPESNQLLPVDGNIFAAIRSAVKSAIRQTAEDKGISSEQRGAMYSKIGELNRESFGSVAARFFQRVFEPYPAQKVEGRDVQRFIAIRNRLTHGARMHDELADELGVATANLMRTVNEEYVRLAYLLERLVLALLNIDNRWMKISWPLVGIGQ